MGIDLLIGFIVTYIVVAIWKGGEAVSKKLDHLGNSREPQKDDYRTLKERLDNRGYEPYNGEINYYNGQYFTLIFGDSDHSLMKHIAASSIEELQQKADPVLIERREAWLKRKARKERRKKRKKQNT